MPNYNLICKKCNSVMELSCSISDFQYSNKNNFENIFCKSCNANSFERIYGSISGKISRSSQEIVQQVREDARKLVEKVKSGDQHAIRDVYGEGE